MIRILGIVGSLRKDSFNRKLMQAVADAAPSGCQFQQAGIEGIPVYDQDLEAESGIPDAVLQLQSAAAEADGLVLFSPEYNQGVPGPMKNAIDWMSRPPKRIPEIFGDKPVALAGATPGGGGTRTAQYAWLPTLRGLGTRPWFGGALYMGGAGKLFDEQGGLRNQEDRDRVAGFIEGFANFCGLPRVVA